MKPFQKFSLLRWFGAGIFFAAMSPVAAEPSTDPAPPARATLIVEADAALALLHGPHTADAITRDRYFRLYHFPGMFDESLAADLRSLRAAPARGTGPYLSDKGGDTGRLAWTTRVDESAARYAEIYRRGAVQHPGATHAIAGGSYPTCQPMTDPGAAKRTTDATMFVRYNRTVEPDQFDANAGIIATWLDGIAAADAPKPRYFSPFNEPDVSWKAGENLSLKHAEFARTLALRLRDDHPDVLVSGPSTSWPYPGETWARWQPEGWERAFIEQVGDVAGAYDFHFYTKDFWAYGTESPGFRSEFQQSSPNLHSTLWTGHHQMLDFGKGEALLDLAQSLHLAKWHRSSPPVIISEFGRQGLTPQLGPWANDYLYYLYGTTVTRLWMMFMDRPEVTLTVPFILPVGDVGYGPKRGQALYTRPGAPDDVTPVVTPLRDYYGFFRDFEGERVPTKWVGLDPKQAIGVFTIAAHRGKTLFILLHNAAESPLAFQLSLPEGTKLGGEPTIQRMRWEGSIPADHRAPTPSDGRWRRDLDAMERISPSRIEIAAEETALLRIPLEEAPTRQVVVKRYYSPENMRPLDADQPAVFEFNLPSRKLPGEITAAELVFVFAAPAGGRAGQTLELALNGKPLDTHPDLGLLENWRHPVHPYHVAVPKDLLKAGVNTLTIAASNEVPKSSQIVTVRLDIRSELPIGAPGNESHSSVEPNGR
jgi:hypothetical protein